MAARKEPKPQYQTPYKVVDVSKDGITYPIEVLNDGETKAQAEMRWECVKRTAGMYKERTEELYGKRHLKLFEVNTEADVMKAIVSDTNPSMTPQFKYRSYADILESKLPLITNTDYVKLVKFAIKSLREYGCIHPEIKDIIDMVS